MGAKNIINDMEIKKYIKNIPESFRKFAEEVQSNSVTPPHSMYVVGSVLTPDYVPGGSDINSLIVIEEHQLEFLDFLILLGKEFKEHGIAPPLVMTAEYIDHSLDVFPIKGVEGKVYFLRENSCLNRKTVLM